MDAITPAGEGPNLIVYFAIAGPLMAVFVWAVLANRKDPSTGQPRWRWLPHRLDGQPPISRAADRRELILAGTICGLTMIAIVTATMMALHHFGIIGR
jgi:hypothetical protein